MKVLKTVFSVIIIAALLLAVAVGVFWEKLLSPAQKLRYGKQFSAVEDLRQQSADAPDDSQALADYVDGLALEGNIGRAYYLSELYGVHNDKATALRGLAVRSLQQSTDGRILDITAEPEAQQFMETPAWEVLRYLEGYRHALSGDWMSARNEFMGIANGDLPPALRGWHKYYLARAYRYGGDEEQKQLVLKLLREVVEAEAKAGQQGSLLHGRAVYNIIDWCVSDDYPGEDGPQLATEAADSLDELHEAWARQKGDTALGDYLLANGDPGGAWRLSSTALLLDPAGNGGKAAGELALRSMQEILAAFSNKGTAGSPDWQPAEEPLRPLMNPSGELQVELGREQVRAIADWAVANEKAAEASALLVALRAHVSERAAWEELRVGEAICYRSAKDRPAMQALMLDANLHGMSDRALSEIYFENGLLLKGSGEWNGALDQLRSSATLNGPRSGEAWFQCYLVLKRVQDPLNVDSAIGYLQHVMDGDAASDAFPRAFEELVPLLIHNSSRTAARQLCERVLGLATGGTMEGERGTELATVARFWLGWIAQQEGDSALAKRYRSEISITHWNYYEITAHQGIEPHMASVPAVLGQPESAGEYFAGMGLTTNAAEVYNTDGPADSQLLAFFRIDNAVPVMDLPSVQWRATEVLESGAVNEAALLEYVLAQSYPRPFDDVVNPAAQEFNVDPALIYAVIKKESNFKPADVSWAGAEGLMQLMPESAKWLNERYSLGVDLTKLRDPKQNVRLGAANLRSLYDQLGQDNIRGVIIAHNKGAGNYQKWTGRYGSNPVLISELVPNEENEGFIKRVLRYYLIYKWLEER
ncbi:lytic transglycosylase domain-containing protein [bacterium]|nr:lytic transglycosylase domain-containing protein [bacterium]